MLGARLRPASSAVRNTADSSNSNPLQPLTTTSDQAHGLVDNCIRIRGTLASAVSGPEGIPVIAPQHCAVRVLQHCAVRVLQLVDELVKPHNAAVQLLKSLPIDRRPIQAEPVQVGTLVAPSALECAAQLSELLLQMFAPVELRNVDAWDSDVCLLFTVAMQEFLGEDPFPLFVLRAKFQLEVRNLVRPTATDDTAPPAPQPAAASDDPTKASDGDASGPDTSKSSFPAQEQPTGGPQAPKYFRWGEQKPVLELEPMTFRLLCHMWELKSDSMENAYCAAKQDKNANLSEDALLRHVKLINSALTATDCPWHLSRGKDVAGNGILFWAK